jgi:Short C-terminal domain
MNEEKIEKKLGRLVGILLPGEEDATYLGSCNARVPNRKGKIETVTGDLYLTNTRLIHLGKVIGAKSLTSVELRNIVNLSTDAGMALSWLEVSTANTVARFQLSKQEALRILSLLQSRRENFAVTTTPASVQKSPLEQLELLGDLLTKGVLTQDEFESKKAEILKRI